jgi:choline-sulfatase
MRRSAKLPLEILRQLARCPASICLALFLAALSLSAQPAPSRVSRKPSVILISIDTLRADRLSCYSPRAPKTPNLDKIAQGGTLFSAINSQVPLTLPSHVSMFTSFYPFETGVQDNGDHLSPGVVTLATVLKSSGYRTGAFIGGFVLDRRFGLDEGFDIYDSSFDIGHTQASDPGDVKRRGKEVTESAKKWLQERSPQPFFLFLHIYDLHTPYNLSSEDRKKYGEGYTGELGYIDDVVGDLWTFLRTKKLLDDSLVILTSDHGESLGDHGETTHGFFIYQSTLHVPLIIHWTAGRSGMPTHVNSPGGLIDLAPTVLAAIQLPVPGSMKGRNLLSPAEGDVYSESVYPQKHFGASPLASLRRGRYKLIDAPRPELFDLAADPVEEKNLYAARQPIASALRERLSRLHELHPTNKKKPEALSPEAEEKLHALGYLTTARSTDAEIKLPDPKDKIAEYEQYGHAIGMARAGQFAAANELLADLIKKDPNLVDVRLNFGLNLQRLGKDGEAVDVFREVLKADPANAMAHFDAGLSYYNLQRLEDAEKELEAALAISPDYTKAESLLANILVRQQRLEQARASFNHILQITPADFDAHYNLGVLAAMASQWDEGIEHLRSALAVDQSSAEAHNTLGSIFLRKRDFSGALAELHEAVRLKPDFVFAHYNLGLAHRALGDGESARQEFEKALAIDPHFSAARTALSR